jgi:transposase
MKTKAPKGKSSSNEPPPGAGADELPERWSVQRKAELVLRLLRGEGLEGVSRESQVPAHELERWQRIFMDQGKRGLRTKTEPEERELILARAKIGELMMRLELAEDLIETRGFTDEWKRRKA